MGRQIKALSGSKNPVNNYLSTPNKRECAGLSASNDMDFASCSCHGGYIWARTTKRPLHYVVFEPTWSKVRIQTQEPRIPTAGVAVQFTSPMSNTLWTQRAAESAKTRPYGFDPLLDREGADRVKGDISGVKNRFTNLFATVDGSGETLGRPGQ